MRVGETGVPVQVSAALAARLAELSRALEATDLSAALRHVATLSASLVPGTLAASVTLWRDGAPYTFSASADQILEVDDAQYDEQAGPCLEAAEKDDAVLVDDIAAHRTCWPAFTAAAARRGVRSALSLPLKVADQVVGSLNLYGSEQGAFNDAGVDLARVVAAHGGVAAVNSAVLFEARDLAGQLQQALQSRATIDQAIGIVMATRRVGSSEAFQLLTRQSQNTNRPLRDVAAELVRQADRPRS